jgi:hypothetical protein
MLRSRGLKYGVNSASGLVFGAVFSSVEIQVPSFHPLVCWIFSLSWTVATLLGHSLTVLKLCRILHD